MGAVPRFSIIIPVKEINGYVRETVPYIQALDSDNWELIIVPNESDKNEWLSDKRVSLISSGRVGPADKRDQAAKIARGEILVFLDDDSYPQSDLLSIAAKHFNDKSISALGGPAMTPKSDSYWQKVSGAVFLSKFTGGNPERYIPVGRVREVEDWPSVNLMVKRIDFLEVNGFNSPYWPGEDTHLCLKLVQKQKKLIYDPNLIVYHHRRSGFVRHIKQVGAYGLHRGYFARHMPETSLKLKYLLPSILTLVVVTSPIAIFSNSNVKNLYISALTTYALVVVIGAFDITRKSEFPTAAGAILYTIPTHLYYGMQFIRGYFKTGKLVSALR
jgi:glycosyltransferase involved in cell wall biosynthesis